MFSLDKITGFDWDFGNEQKNAKHGVLPSEAEQVFLNEPIIILDDPKHSDIEQRYHALGQTGAERLLQVTFTVRSDKIRVISARDMHRKERLIYEQKT